MVSFGRRHSAYRKAKDASRSTRPDFSFSFCVQVILRSQKQMLASVICIRSIQTVSMDSPFRACLTLVLLLSENDWERPGVNLPRIVNAESMLLQIQWVFYPLIFEWVFNDRLDRVPIVLPSPLVWTLGTPRDNQSFKILNPKIIY